MTELIWDGKYKDGKKSAPVRVALPFQAVETVNASAPDRQTSLGFARDEWRNRLIWGDKKYVLPSLLPDLAGKVDLIYIDPPFATGDNFSFTTTVPDSDESFTREPSVIEQKAYRDTWGRGLDSYLQWFYETAILLRELLSETGSLYVHLDYHIGCYAKVVLDEVLGPDSFKNEIVWKRTTSHSDAGHYGSVHDTIYFYNRSVASRLNEVFQKYDEEYIESYYRYRDEDGRRFMSADLSGAGAGPPRQFGDKFISPPAGRHWMYDQAGIDKALATNRIFWTRNGIPRLKRYIEDAEGMRASDMWADIQALRSWHKDEAVAYSTQKPEALLERIISASSNPGDIVLDCFCGSGTTAAAAEKLGRRWIASDLGRFAVHTTRKRLLGIEGVKPFDVQNLGKYERQVWQAAQFGDGAEAAQRSYRDFILSLYHATPVPGFIWLHGVKRGRMVHVGTLDSPISVGEVTQIALEWKKAIGTGENAPTSNGVDVLGWDFAFELNEVARQTAAEAGIDVRFVRIPREVMEQKAVDQGDIKFYELAALDVAATVKGKKATLTLNNFMMSLDDVPEDVRAAVKKWSQWIDYWAVDWDNKDDAFHNMWQSYRAKKAPNIELSAAHVYDAPGIYRVVVKVIDILGNDTTKALNVEVMAGA